MPAAAMSWSTQAKILFGLYALSAVLFSAAIIFKEKQLVTGLLIGAIMLGMGYLMGFDTNCLTEGGCEVWSIIRTIFYSINAGVLAISAGAILVGKQ